MHLLDIYCPGDDESMSKIIVKSVYEADKQNCAQVQNRKCTEHCTPPKQSLYDDPLWNMWLEVAKT